MTLARILVPVLCILPLAACGLKRSPEPAIAVTSVQSEWFEYDTPGPRKKPESPAAPAAPRTRPDGEWGSYGWSPRPRTGHWKGSTAWRHPPKERRAPQNSD